MSNITVPQPVQSERKWIVRPQRLNKAINNLADFIRTKMLTSGHFTSTGVAFIASEVRNAIINNGNFSIAYRGATVLGYGTIMISIARELGVGYIFSMGLYLD